MVTGQDVVSACLQRLSGERKSGGGIIDVQKADAFTNVLVTGTLMVGNNTVIEGNRVDISTDIRGSTKAIASNSGGGVVAVGDANGKAVIDVDSTLNIGQNTVIRATGIVPTQVTSQ